MASRLKVFKEITVNFQAYLASQQQRFAHLDPVDRPFAYLQPHASPGVLLLHGSAASPCNQRDLAQLLFAQGYHVYAPLLAGHDHLEALYQGKTSWQTCLAQALQDADHFASVCTSLHGLGSSYGGTLVYLLGIERPLTSVIALSAPVIADDGWFPRDPWGQQIKGAITAVDRHLRDFGRPLAVAHAIDDELVKVANAYYAFETVASTRKKMLLYAGVGHGLGFVQNTPELAADLHQFMQYTQSPRQVSLTFQDENYQQLAVAGSFNQWRAHPCYRTLEGWRWEMALPPGKYAYKLVINGQHWILDPDAPRWPAPHGEENSLLEVSP